MKKTLFILLILAACGKEIPAPVNNPTPTPTPDVSHFSPEVQEKAKHCPPEMPMACFPGQMCKCTHPSQWPKGISK